MIDAHVHLFPDRLFDAIWSWFDENAWHIPEKLYADDVVDRLEEAGNQHVVGLLYAHREGMADELNAWIGALAKRRSTVVPCATVHPLDPAPGDVIARAKEAYGARLVKQHCHVLGIAPDDPRMFPLYEPCIDHNLPINLHAGNGPKLVGYSAPTDRISGAARTEPVLRRYPELKLIVPHLGCMEEERFIEWLGIYPNLYLDTSMALAPFEPDLTLGDRDILGDHADRVMFGTDFPNIPFALGTEKKALDSLGFPKNVHRAITHDTAARLFGLTGRAGASEGAAPPTLPLVATPTGLPS